MSAPRRRERTVVQDFPVAPEPQDSTSRPSDDSPVSAPGSGDREPWADMAQVVSLQRSRLEPAAVEIAIVMRGADDRYVRRRVRCIGKYLESGLPYLFDPDPDALAHGGASSTRWVQDHHFDTADQALEEARTQDPPADPTKWRTEFSGEFFADVVAPQLLPEAERVGLLGRLVAWPVALVVFLTLFGFAESVLAGLGLVFAGADGDDGDVIILFIVSVAAFWPAHAVYRSISGVFRRRNLARALSR